MISIIEHIDYLVQRHDCVVVPGLGALIGRHEPARIDAELGCIFPPRRCVAFNAELVHNDGLLAGSVARRHGLAYEQASAEVAAAVAAMLRQLRQEGETGLGHLGTLSLTAEGAVAFSPYEPSAPAMRYAGLSAVKALPVEADSGDSGDTADSGEEPAPAGLTVASRLASFARGAVRAAAMVAVMATLGLMLTTPIVDSRATRASMAPALELPAAAGEEACALDALRALDERTNGLELVVAAPRAAENAESGNAAAPAMRCEASDRYCLVVASLPSERLATDYAASHPYGSEMHVLVADGRWRLYVATGATYAQAARPMAMPGFADRYPQAWVCRR